MRFTNGVKGDFIPQGHPTPLGTNFTSSQIFLDPSFHAREKETLGYPLHSFSARQMASHDVIMGTLDYFQAFALKQNQLINVGSPSFLRDDTSTHAGVDKKSDSHYIPFALPKTSVHLLHFHKRLNLVSRHQYLICQGRSTVVL